jgi:hypothetical protein
MDYAVPVSRAFAKKARIEAEHHRGGLLVVSKRSPD